ncbi:hypothetical protein BDF22DRAFT_739434 [Syncephalis plumigaleata]|nr:hypothetical protein BDF22DRAFT_739434 [Syncephalis plumigaleata]
MTPLALCQLLVARFRWALIQPQSDDVERRVVRIRLYVVLRHWLLDHYTTDFHKSRPVRRHLARFLDTLPEHPVIQASQRDHRIMQQLRRLFRRLRMYHRRSARTRAPINGDLLVLRHTMYEDATQQTSHHQHSASHSGSFSSSIIAIIQRPSNESADSAARATTTGSTSIGPRQRPQLYDIPSIPMMNTSVEPADSTRYVYAGTFLLPPLAFKVLPPLPTKQLPSLPYEQYDKKPLPILPQDEEKLAVSTVYSSSGNSDDDDSSYRRRRTPHHRRHRHMPSITSGLASDVCSITSMPHRQTLQRPTSTPSLHRFLTGNQSDSTINVQHPRYLAQQQRYPNPLANATTRVFRMNEARNTIRNKRHTFPKRKLSQLAITIDDTEPGAWRRTMTTALLGEVARVKRGVAGSVRARMRKRTISSSIEICNCGWQDPHDNALANANANATTTIQNDHVMSSNDTDDDDDNLPSEVLTPPKSDSSSNNNNSKSTMMKSFNPRRMAARLFQSTNADEAETCQSDSAITSAVRSPLRHQIRATPESSLNNDDNDNGNDDDDDDDDGKQHHSDPTMMITPPTPMDDANEHQSDEVKTNEIALDANETEIIQPHAQPNVSVSRKNSRRYRPRRASRLSATASAARDTLRRAHGSWRNHRLNLRRRSTRGQSITTCPNCACLLPMGSQEEIDAIRRRWHTVGSDEIGEKAGMILEYRSEMVAAACCVIESEVLRAIHWRDLLDVSWNRAPTSAGDRTSGVRRLIDRFNSFTQWVVSEIVSVTTVDKRARLIEKYIRVALKCYLFGNFTTVLQILLGLQSPAVERLTRTWSRVDAYERRVLNELQTLSNPARNWAVLRRAMEKHAEKMLAADPQDQGGCLPFLGIYLSDLVYNTELPSYVDYNLQPVNIQEVLGWQSSGSLHTNITLSTCSTTGGQSSSGYDRSLDTASTLNGSISGSTHSRNRSLGGQSIAPALAAVMLVNRSPARKRGISNCSNYSDPNGVIRVFTGQETDIESSSNNNDHHHHHQSDPSNAHSILSSSTTVTPLVNYHRHRNTANVLRRVMAYQLLAARFTMELDVELRTCLEQLHCLDNPTVNALSREREPPPARVIASVPHITPERSASRRTTIVDH